MLRPEVTRTGSSAGWLGLGVAGVVAGVWFISVASSPGHAPPRPGAFQAEARRLDGALHGQSRALPFVPGGTTSPYDVMVALAEYEALGDTLAAARAALLAEAEAGWPEAASLGSLAASH
jgi:hypothetical protein